jgi:FlaG/FlaF family flagellin (archaellin)
MNSKNIIGSEAVSAVIGIILAVAIVVALAATVYFYMSNMIDEAPKKTPQINFFADESIKTLTVLSYNQEINWQDINMTATDNTNTIFNHSQTGNVDAGDTIYFNDNGVIDGDIIIKFRYNPTNTLIGVYELTSITK